MDYKDLLEQDVPEITTKKGQIDSVLTKQKMCLPYLSRVIDCISEEFYISYAFLNIYLQKLYSSLCKKSM